MAGSLALYLSSNRSMYSTRIGDWASMMWTSVRWANESTAVRRPARPAWAPVPMSVRTT